MKSTAAPVRLLALALLAARPDAADGQITDTALEVRGFLQRDSESGRWRMLLQQPIPLLGVRAKELSLKGEVERWIAFANRFVEVDGRASSRLGATSGVPALELNVAGVREVEPAGTSRRAVNRGPVWHELVTLAVVPQRIAWQDADGKPSGVTPVLFYSIVNKQAGAVVMQLPSDELLCFSVKPDKGPVHWSDTTRLQDPAARRFVIPHGDAYREAVLLPQAAALGAGRYVARAGLCRIGDYDVSTKFEVQ